MLDHGSIGELAKKAAPIGAILSCCIYAAQAFGLLSSAMHAEYATKKDLGELAAKVETVIQLLEHEHESGQRSESRRYPSQASPAK